MFYGGSHPYRRATPDRAGARLPRSMADRIPYRRATPDARERIYRRAGARLYAMARLTRARLWLRLRCAI